MQEAFLGFVNKVPFYGAGVLCLDDGPVQDILPRVERRVVTYGLSRAGAGLGARRARSGRRARRYIAAGARARRWARSSWRCPGAHNVLNSLAAVAVGLELEVPFDEHPAGPRRLHRRRPPLPGPRRGGRRPRGRRLRPPPDGDPRHPRDPARPRGQPPHGGPVPAPPLHAHPAPLGRLLPRLPPGRPAAPGRHLPRGRGADRRASPREALAEAIARRGPPRRSSTRATSRRPRAARAGGARRRRGADPRARAASGRRATSCSSDAQRGRRDPRPSPAFRRSAASSSGSRCRRRPSARSSTPLEPEDDAPFLRPERRTRVRRRRRGLDVPHDPGPAARRPRCSSR